MESKCDPDHMKTWYSTSFNRMPTEISWYKSICTFKVCMYQTKPIEFSVDVSSCVVQVVAKGFQWLSRSFEGLAVYQVSLLAFFGRMCAILGETPKSCDSGRAWASWQSGQNQYGKLMQALQIVAVMFSLYVATPSGLIFFQWCCLHRPGAGLSGGKSSIHAL